MSKRQTVALPPKTLTLVTQMARVRLYYEETRAKALPALCMKCGEPATTHVRRTFSWYPQWVFVLVLVAIPVYVIVALILTKRMAVEVPLCDRHRGHWWKRQLIMYLPLLAIFGLALLAYVGIAQQSEVGG